MSPVNLDRPWLSALRAVFLAACAVGLLNILWSADGLAQDSDSLGGLAKGERDSLRVDSRMEGREERIVDSRVSDQKIGYEERKIRLERRAEELLREEEVTRDRQERFAKEEEEAGDRARRRESEDRKRKKRAVDLAPDL